MDMSKTKETRFSSQQQPEFVCSYNGTAYIPGDDQTRYWTREGNWNSAFSTTWVATMCMTETLILHMHDGSSVASVYIFLSDKNTNIPTGYAKDLTE